MTLIAQVQVGGAWFLVGDVLLSSEGKSGLKSNLPLVGDINQIIADRGLAFEVGFKQKVNILSDRLVVAWAGPHIQARRALEVLAAISSRQNLSVADIQTELEAIDPERIDQLSLIGLLVTDVRGTTVSASRFSLRVQGVDVPGLGTVYAAGTGREEFVQHLEKADLTMQGVANEFQVAHAVVADLIDWEYRRGGTIENRWGGGFEAVTFASDTGRFQKVGDVLHTFWSVDLRSPENAQFKPSFYKTTYWRDALIIRYARFDSVAAQAFQLTMNGCQLIPPLLKDAKEYDLSELGSVDFSYKALCCHVSIERPDGRSVMHVFEPAKPNAILELDPAGRLHIPGKLTKMVIEEARTRASRLQPQNMAQASKAARFCSKKSER